MLVFVIIALLGQEPSKGDDTPFLKTIADGYDANRLALSSGEFKFRYVESHSDTAEHARRGQISNALRYDGRYAFAPEMARYEVILAEARLLDNGANPGNGKIPSWRTVFSGGQSIVDMIFSTPDRREMEHIPILSTGQAEFYSHFRFPINLGQRDAESSNLSDDIRSSLTANGGLTMSVSNTDEIIQDIHVTHLVMLSATGRRDYWVDIKRGCIPLISKDTMNTGTETTIYHDDVRFWNNVWLPFSQTTFIKSGGLAKQVEILNATAEPRLDRKDFALQFDSTTSLYDPEKSRLLKGRKSWDAAQVKSIPSKDTRPVNQKPVVGKPPEMPAALQTSEFHLRRLAGVLLLTLGIALVAWMIIKRAKKHA